MSIRPACAEDLAELERVYIAAIGAMRGTPFDIMWDMGSHPTRESLAAAVEAGDLFVAEAPGSLYGPDGHLAIAGAFVLDGNQEAGYAIADWPSAAPACAVGVIHLLVVDPARRGQGIGRALVEGAKEVARARGMRAIRLDAFDNNAPGIALYRACGFADLGVFTMDYGEGFTHGVNLMEFDLACPGSTTGA